MANKLTGKQRSILLAKQTAFVAWLIVKWVIVCGLVAGFLAGGMIAGYVSALVRDEPVRSPEEMLAAINRYDQTGFVYFNDGTLIGQLRTSEDRRLVESIREIPKHVRDAFVSVEDFRFEQHFGIDIFGTLRAVKERFLNEDRQSGGSTITQQLARRVFLSLEQTDARKFKEMFLAMRMERIMTKDDILLAYLNKMPFGNGSSGYQLYGIKAAAKGIFDVDDLNDLNIAQAAYLAGLLKAPSDYSAFDGYGRFDEDGFRKAMDRQKVVLQAMLKTGAITKKEYEDALKFDIRSTLAETKPKAYTTYPYLMIEAERRAAEKLLLLANPDLTEEDLKKKENAPLIQDAIEWMNRSGYHIYTTIDKDMYDAMQAIAKKSGQLLAGPSGQGHGADRRRHDRKQNRPDFGDDRRARFLHRTAQPRHPDDAAAGFGDEAVRLPARAGRGHHPAGLADRRHAHHPEGRCQGRAHSGEPRRQIPWPDHRAARLQPVVQRARPEAVPERSSAASASRRHGITRNAWASRR